MNLISFQMYLSDMQKNNSFFAVLLLNTDHLPKNKRKGWSHSKSIVNKGYIGKV